MINENSYLTQVRKHFHGCNYTKFQFEKKMRLAFDVCQIFQEYPVFADFTVGMVGNETEHLLECV